MKRPDLLFHWLVREGRGLRLFLAGGAVVLTLIAFVLLFQVVYPAASREPLSAQRILLLDRSSPAARPILDAVSDRDFLQLPLGSNAAPQLTAHAPVFTPSFKNFEFRARDFIEVNSGAASATLPRLFRPDRPPLPPLPKTSIHTAAHRPLKPQVLRPFITEGLTGRTITRPTSFAGPQFASAEGTSYRVAVDQRGRITLVIPITDPTAQPETTTVFKAVRDQLDLLRFQPTDSTEIAWGKLTLRWLETTTAP